MGRLFLTFLFLNLCDCERFAFNRLKGFLSLFLTGKLALGGSKGGVTIHGCQDPIRLRLEVLDLLLAVHDQSEGRGLHATDTEHLTVLAIPKGIEAGGIHA